MRVQPEASLDKPKVFGMKRNEPEFWLRCKLLKNGGQGRNRTADASLFRAEVFQSYHVELKDLRPPQEPQSARFIGTVMGQQFGVNPSVETICN